jgi:hypothetical protein
MFVRACDATADDVARWECGWRRVHARLDTGPHSWVSAGSAGVPHQLPGGVPDLVGRRDALDRLDGYHRERAARRPRGLLALVVGPAGVGTTAVALHWAHQITQEYPDGQLYVDLRAGANGPASTPDEALLLLLNTLGLAADEVPAGFSARVGLYRSLTYPRRMLVILDNARDAEQVRPLLPGGPDCTTLVTSRNRLSALVALDGGTRLSLAPLRAEGAIELLGLTIGDARVLREPAAVESLARLCGYLPLALRIAAANLADRPQWSVADYVAQLTAGNRLAQLAVVGDESTAVRAAFDLSYAALHRPTRWVFRRLASAPHPEFTVDDVAALTRRSPAEAGRQLEALAADHLVEPTGVGHYAMSDLLRLYAAYLPDDESDEIAGTSPPGQSVTRLGGAFPSGWIPTARRPARPSPQAETAGSA